MESGERLRELEDCDFFIMAHIILLIGSCSPIFVSCSKDKLFPDFIYEMTVSKEAINVVPEGTDETVEVKSNYAWTVGE